MSTVTSLVRAAHIGPTVAVTVMAGLLAAGAGNDAATIGLVVVSVLTGQLSIGWSNDLVDSRRDRVVGRLDKPLATGEVSTVLVRAALAVATASCVVVSPFLGLAAAACSLLVMVSGWAYNLGLKGTAWSWLPYALAFGSLPGVATLALDPSLPPPWWMVLAGALLGVGAHFVNVLPDLADDAVTGVRGMPHRLGSRGSRAVAAATLVAASVVAAVAPRDLPLLWSGPVLVAAAALGWLVVAGQGRAPFRAAVGIALLDVGLLTLAGGGTG
jgi:4-hydroxybenzoate polyprenyltransferase